MDNFKFDEEITEQLIQSVSEALSEGNLSLLDIISGSQPIQSIQENSENFETLHKELQAIKSSLDNMNQTLEKFMKMYEEDEKERSLYYEQRDKLLDAVKNLTESNPALFWKRVR